MSEREAIHLESLTRCFEGLVPAAVATCSADGVPNISYVSQVYYVDPKHVAISFQFFNKTRRNVQENPYASVIVYDPLTMKGYRLRLRFVRSETEGPLFEQMRVQLQVIASHTGLGDVFLLRAADIYEVLEIERLSHKTIEESEVAELQTRKLPKSPVSDIDSLWVISERLSREQILGNLLETALLLLEQHFGLRHSMILLWNDCAKTLQTLASRGYAENGVGSEVALGQGLIGTAAQCGRALRIDGIEHKLRYARAVRETAESAGSDCRLEIPLPGLPEASNQLAVPLIARGELVGVLAVESSVAGTFGPREESLLSILGNQLAASIVHLKHEAEREASDDEVKLEGTSGTEIPALSSSERTLAFRFFHADDCVFVDNEYLIRNVPGRILWRLLLQYKQEGRSEFSNRELRMDPWLGLPDIKDNLETRLILLRKRLEQKCPEVRLVQRGRGRFRLELRAALTLSEQKSP